MTVAIHQPNFLPWIGYFYKIHKSETFIFLDNVQFSKNSFQNRVKIKTSQGAKWLTVPILHNFGQLTKDVEINNSQDWRKRHLKTLEANYKRSPHFEAIYNWLKDIYFKNTWSLMADFNIELIKGICDFLHIERKTLRASSMNVRGSATDLLINILKNTKAGIYLSGKGGATYQNKKDYQNAGITLAYSDFKHPTYPQLWGEFVGGLSVIDLLFNCGAQSMDYLSNG